MKKTIIKMKLINNTKRQIEYIDNYLNDKKQKYFDEKNDLISQIEINECKKEIGKKAYCFIFTDKDNNEAEIKNVVRNFMNKLKEKSQVNFNWIGLIHDIDLLHSHSHVLIFGDNIEKIEITSELLNQCSI